MRYRTPGHCEPVTDVTGVAISRIEAPFLMDEFREMAGKNACMTMGCLEFDGDSHTRKANWFGMTVLFEAHAHLYKFPICRTTERYRAGQAGNENRPRLSRLVSGDSPPNSHFPASGFSRQPEFVFAGRTFHRARRTFLKKPLTNVKKSSKIAPTFIEQGCEGKSKPADAVQRAPVGGKGYG